LRDNKDVIKKIRILKMKKIIILAALVASSNFAIAAESFYVKVGLQRSTNRVSFNNNDIENTKTKLNKSKFGFLVGAGYNICEKSRMEVTIDQNKYTKDDYKVKLAKLMLNGEYDIVEITKDINLYGAAGLGMAKVKVQDLKKNKFAFSVGAGVNGKINKDLSWDIGYKYSHISKAKGYVDSSTNTIGGIKEAVKISQHSVIAGIKYHF
jgi:opacity protein-like surface antigen